LLDLARAMLSCPCGRIALLMYCFNVEQLLYICSTVCDSYSTVIQLLYGSIDAIMDMSHFCKALITMAKDTAMNIRVSSEDLELIKQTAKANGYDKYSEWCLSVLLDAANKTSILSEVETIKERLEALERVVYQQSQVA